MARAASYEECTVESGEGPPSISGGAGFKPSSLSATVAWERRDLMKSESQNLPLARLSRNELATELSPSVSPACPCPCPSSESTTDSLLPVSCCSGQAMKSPVSFPGSRTHTDVVYAEASSWPPFFEPSLSSDCT